MTYGEKTFALLVLFVILSIFGIISIVSYSRYQDKKLTYQHEIEMKQIEMQLSIDEINKLRKNTNE